VRDLDYVRFSRVRVLACRNCGTRELTRKDMCEARKKRTGHTWAVVLRVGLMIKVWVSHGIEVFRKFEGSYGQCGSGDRANVDTGGRREIDNITFFETRTGNPATDTRTGGRYF